MAVILAIAAALTYGAGDFLGGLATKRIGEALGVVAASSLVGAALFLVLAPAIAGEPTFADLAWGVAAGIGGGAGVILFYRALAEGVMSIVAPVAAVTSALVPVAVGLALGERPSGLALAGVALAIVAVALLSRQTAGAREETPRNRVRVFTFACVAGLGFGAFFVFLDQTGDDAGMWPLVASRSTTLVIAVCLALVLRRPLAIPAGTRLAVVGTGLFDMSANALFLLANREGLLTLVAVIVSLYPASTIALAQGFLGERLERHQVVGVGLAGVAVVLIAV